MKYLYIFIFIISSYLTKSQDTTFNKLLYSNDRTKVVCSILKNDSNFYILFANVNVNPYKAGYGLLKLNNEYKTIDSSVYESTTKLIGINNGKGFILDKRDTTFVLCGGRMYPNNQKLNGYIAKFNKDLDTIWTKQIMHPDTAYADTAQTPWTTLRDIKITPEGDYLIVGNYNHHCQGNMDNSFIIKMDTSGNILWYKFLDPNLYESYITTIEIDQLDTGFYITSYINNAMQLIKFDKNGNYLWKTSFNYYPSLTWVSDIEVVGDQIIIGSNYFIPPWIPYEQEAKLYIVSVDRQTQNINWDRKINSISVVSKYLRQEVIDIEEMPNGNIAVGSVGMKYLDSTFYPDVRANLLMLSPNGDSLWSHYYTYQNDSLGVEDMQFNDMVACDDGGILFGGFYITKQDYITRPWLVKTDSLGNSPGMFTVGIEEDELVIKNYELRIYPNPTTDNINLSINEKPKSEFQLQIYNISGQLVLEKQLPAFNNEYRINIKELNSGVYIVKLISEDNEVYSGKVVKEN